MLAVFAIALGGGEDCARMSWLNEDPDVEITPVCRAAYFDEGIEFAPSPSGTILLGHGARERWHTSPMHFAGPMPAMPAVPLPSGYEPSERSYSDRAVACGPKEYAALWRRSAGRGALGDPAQVVQVEIGIYMSDHKEAESVIPKHVVSLTAGAGDTFLHSVTMIADTSRRLIVVASEVTCVVLRFSPSAPKLGVAACLDEVWRTEHLPRLELSRPDGPAGGGAPFFLLAPQQPEGGDGVFLVAMQTHAVVFLHMGGTATEPSVLHAVDISVPPLGRSILRLWRRQPSEPPLLLLSRNRVLQAVDVPDLESWKLETRSKARHRPMSLLRHDWTSKGNGTVGCMDVCDRHDLCLTGGHGSKYIYLWRLLSAVDMVLLKRINVGDGAERYNMMHLSWVPKGPLTSFFVANSNDDDMTFATLHFVQLYRQPALLTTLLCLRRCAPELYAVGSTARSASESTTRVPRGSSLLMTICELAGLEPPGRCSCSWTYNCVCFGDPSGG